MITMYLAVTVAAAGGDLVFDLPGEGTRDAIVERVKPATLGDVVRRGRIAEAPGSWFILAEHGEVVAGEVSIPGRGHWHVRGTAGALEFTRVHERLRCLACESGKPPVPGLRSPGPATAETSSSTLIDLMVVYTPSSRNALGGTAATEATIDSWVAYCNMAFEHSQVAHRFRLVNASEIAYVESGNSLTDLARLRALNDGFLDDVHPLRDAVGADLVSLINTSGSAGTGYHMTELSVGFASSGFSAIGADPDPIPGGLVLAHETGHNCGLTHNNGPGAPNSLFCYSYGHRTPDEAWRTIMSSPPGVFVDCFSNPQLLQDGLPLGVSGDGCPNNAADAARSLNEAAATVAMFRPTMIPICTADTDLSGAVDVNDLVAVIMNWGPCGVECPADVNDDGMVGVDDLVAVVEQWGPCT